MNPTILRIPSDEKLPAAADVVVVGGGIVGAAAAYFLAKRGLSVALLEKGYVGCEQSSRSWGWCRRQNRDARELPLASHAMRLWETLAEEIGQDLGFRRCGLLYATDAAIETMKRQGGGHLVNVSSVAGRKVTRDSSGVYAGSKHAVGAISEGLRKELLEDNIRVTIIEPGAVETELATHITDEDAREALGGLLSLEILQAEDVAGAITYAVERRR